METAPKEISSGSEVVVRAALSGEVLWRHVVAKPVSITWQMQKAVDSDKLKLDGQMIFHPLTEAEHEALIEDSQRKHGICCMICAQPCEDADVTESRGENCGRCFPCFLCSECRILLPRTAADDESEHQALYPRPVGFPELLPVCLRCVEDVEVELLPPWQRLRKLIFNI